MGNIVRSIFIVFLEVACCRIFCDIFLGSRDLGKYKKHVLCLSFGVLCMAEAYFFNAHFLVKEVLVFLSVAFFMKLYSSRSFLRCLFLAAIYLGLLLAADFGTLIYAHIFFPGVDFTQPVPEFLIAAMDKAVFFIVTILLQYLFCDKNMLLLHGADWLKFSLLPFFSGVMVTVILSDSAELSDVRQGELWMALSGGLVGIDILAFVLFRDTLQREAKLQENRFFEMEMKNKALLYETLSESVQKQREAAHEYRNRMDIIRMLCENGKTDELRRYLAEINGDAWYAPDRIDTHHAIVNAVVNQKYYEAVEKNILFIFSLGHMGGLCMKNEDIALLLSNLLNNALEAADKCKEDRYIKFRMTLKSGQLYIGIKNACDGRLLYKTGKNGEQEFVTTKENADADHGYGLKHAIKAIRDNYGDYVIRTEGREFYIAITIPQDPQSVR